ncbi:MAG: hypothetical protein JWL77_3339 [Chthonomonadaceae bacterium]|jgi:hypothetical protein|nr:hypothetical protein [Chthonomonadaceae bacterium]
MALFQLPLFAELEKSQTILLAGAGGGFDLFTGLPLYFALREAGKQVFLANLSFSSIYASNGRRSAPALVEVTAHTRGSETYFPELHLARWLQKRGEEGVIYCLDRTGVQPLLRAYSYLMEKLQPDTIILVDGGTDSLMRGDEAGLGTPEEDIASIAVVDQLEVERKFLVCLGFGIDAFHGVCHAQVLEAVAEITRAGGFLGAWTITPEMPEAKLYREAIDEVHRAMPRQPSIVNSSILSAIEGHFGDYHATSRTNGSELFINPLMTLYWAFQLEHVARRILYLDKMLPTESNLEVQQVTYAFRASLQETREWKNLPI